MEHPSTPAEFIGPGLPRQTYLDLLASGGETGWYDENGTPAPWPEDFLEPDSGWQPTTGDPKSPTAGSDNLY